jgi:glycosyltransferase involved in cell wall biosynthesis
MSPVASLPPSCGHGIVYVQHLETWDSSPEELAAAWHLPLRHVATSTWLVEELAARGVIADKVPVGIDHDVFFVEVPPEQRVRPTVVFPARDLEWKGTAIALRAVELARREVPDLEVTAFAPHPLGSFLPESVRLTINPSPQRLRAIYNSAQVFVAPSLSEGWDLPACEAMACGAALVASAIPIRAEYATHQESAILARPGDPVDLAAGMVRLVRDASMRLRLAAAGRASVAELTWERAAVIFDRLLRRLVGSGASVESQLPR